MVGGTIIVSVCLIVLGWTREIVTSLLSGVEEKTIKSVTIALAVMSIYGVDFAINAVQASCRSLIVDTLPIPKQQLGSSWATRMLAVGSLVGYAAGAINLTGIFGTTLGDTQFKQLTSIAALTLCCTVGVTCWAVTERVLLSDGQDAHGELGVMSTFTQILKTALNLPRGIAAICWIQFWAWFGWFPFLFYTTTWVGEIYLRFEASASATEGGDVLGQVGRVGSMALIVFSVITFIGSVCLPWVIKSPDDGEYLFTPRTPASIAPFFQDLEKYKPSLLTVWTVSHLMFTGAMVMAPFTMSVRTATMVVAICGIPWTLQCLAPFTFMGIEINRLSGSTHAYDYGPRSSIELPQNSTLAPINTSNLELSSSSGDKSGAYLGILNLFTTLPQFLGTFVSWIVFSVLEPGKSPELHPDTPEEHHSIDGPNAIGVCLFLGAISAAVAAFQTMKFRRMQR
jgi:solute carrier family 45, member 1/2/4